MEFSDFAEKAIKRALEDGVENIEFKITYKDGSKLTLEHKNLLISVVDAWEKFDANAGLPDEPEILELKPWEAN